MLWVSWLILKLNSVKNRKTGHTFLKLDVKLLAYFFGVVTTAGTEHVVYGWARSSGRLSRGLCALR